MSEDYCNIQGDVIYLYGIEVARITVVESTLRDRFVSLLDPAVLNAQIEEQVQAARDAGYEDGYDDGFEKGQREPA